MFIDTHTHLNFSAFKNDAKEVLARALENNIWVVMPGSQFSTSKRAVEIAERYKEGAYAAVGLHPIHLSEKRHVDELELQSGMTPAPLETARQGRAEFLSGFETQGEEFLYEKYKELGQSKRVVAIGECGLDYYYEPKGKEKREAQRRKQKAALALQLKLAGELGLPVIFHCRKAQDDLIEFLASGFRSHASGLRGVVHCYTGDLKQAEKFYELGLSFGFNGLIFKDVPALPSPKEVIGALPLDRIVLETDSPYLIPPQVVQTPKSLQTRGAGKERNEPLFVKYVAEEIARIKGISVDEVASQTTSNAKTLFSLP